MMTSLNVERANCSFWFDEASMKRNRSTGGYRRRVGDGDVSVLQVIEAVDRATDVGRCVVALAVV
ncbi:MAG: hypothetical protein ABI862_21525 [Ilumatobacteraceae bacterium]